MYGVNARTKKRNVVERLGRLMPAASVAAYAAADRLLAAVSGSNTKLRVDRVLSVIYGKYMTNASILSKYPQFHDQGSSKRVERYLILLHYLFTL